MRITVYLLLVFAISLPEIATAFSWKDYLSAQDVEVEWANTVRGAVRGDTGIGVLKKSTDDAYNFQPLLHSLAELKSAKEVILPVGGLSSGRRKDRVDSFMRMIRYDDGKHWRQLILDQTTEVATRFPELQVYWQVGNEINSWHFWDAIASWEESDEVIDIDPIASIRSLQKEKPEKYGKEKRKQKKGKRNRTEVIPLYVEYFLAPTAQAIIDARKLHPNDATRIKIVLGTIANSHSNQALGWLDSLLNYRIHGEYAPQLAGRQVSDIVDIIALHYMVSSRGPEWRDTMRNLSDHWLGTGSISGIWSTEEIGRKRAMANLGGAAAISVLSRYMDLWHELEYSPKQGRVNFWGWDLGDKGTRAGDAMQTLMKLIGDTQLTPVPRGEVILQSTGEYESYAFRTTQGKLMLVLFSADQEHSPSFNGFRVKWECDSEPDVKMVVFSAKGQHQPESKLVRENGYLTVSSPAVLSRRDLILVVVDSE